MTLPPRVDILPPGQSALWPELEATLPFIKQGQTVQEGPNVRTVLTQRAATTVKVSFSGATTIGRVGVPEETHDGVVRVASLLYRQFFRRVSALALR